MRYILKARHLIFRSLDLLVLVVMEVAMDLR
jgi:hypothetical protein